MRTACVSSVFSFLGTQRRRGSFLFSRGFIFSHTEAQRTQRHRGRRFRIIGVSDFRDVAPGFRRRQCRLDRDVARKWPINSGALSPLRRCVTKMKTRLKRILYSRLPHLPAPSLRLCHRCVTKMKTRLKRTESAAALSPLRLCVTASAAAAVGIGGYNDSAPPGGAARALDGRRRAAARNRRPAYYLLDLIL